MRPALITAKSSSACACRCVSGRPPVRWRYIASMPTDGDDRLPFTCLVPDGPGVIDIYDQTAALRVAVVERDDVNWLSDEWDVPGAYLLLDRPHADGTWSAYVGKAPAGLKSRVASHVKHRDTWCRAVLLQRDTTHGFNSAHAAWLEGRLHDLVGASALGSLSNQQRPGDDTLAPYDRQMLETTIDPIARVLRLIGYETAPPGDELVKPRGRRAPTRYGTTVADLLSTGLLTPGTRLVSTYASASADATVNADGTITWDGHSYATPSAAGCAVREGRATNGWAFWAIETATGKVTLATLRARHSATGAVE